MYMRACVCVCFQLPALRRSLSEVNSQESRSARADSNSYDLVGEMEMAKERGS